MARRHKDRTGVRLEGRGSAKRVSKLSAVAKVVCGPCGKKLLHPTRAQAARHIHQVADRDPRVEDLVVYPCPFRAGFHVGHWSRLRLTPTPTCSEWPWDCPPTSSPKRFRMVRS